MKSVAFYRFLIVGLVVLLVLTGVLSAALIFQAQRELAHFRHTEDTLRAQLKELQLRLAQREEYLNRLENDPAFLDREVRQRLGYVKPDEMIYRFDVDPLTANPLPGYAPAGTTPPNSKPPGIAPKPATNKTPLTSNHTATAHH